MYIKKKYSVKNMVLWTRREIYFFILMAGIPTLLFDTFGLRWLQIPWTALSLIGTAVAFLISFQNNAAYGRIWEARKIWGGIVNTSRTWAMMIQSAVSNDPAGFPTEESELKNIRKVLIHRHIAWLTALRHAMREGRPWEVFEQHRTNREWLEIIRTPEREMSLQDELKSLISEEEITYILSKKNKSAALLNLQARQIKALKDSGLIWKFTFLELEKVLAELFTLQGKSERIKNFPYPRQYATLSYDIVNIFILLLPFGIIPEFDKLGTKLSEIYPLLGPHFVWLAVPFTVVVSWVFNTMHRIGTVGENPFEGSANDVPISTIARGIEIDIREMLDENPADIPAQFPADHNVQM